MSAPRKAPRNRKGPSKGSGGKNKRALEGRGPTPKAEDRVYHKAHRAKVLRERSQNKQGNRRQPTGGRRFSEEHVNGRNAVLEALQASIPAKALYVAAQIDVDDRIREALKIAAQRRIPILEATKPELDRLTDGSVHQGIAIQIPPYDYPDAAASLADAMENYRNGTAGAPLVVALDGITDPRNLGAIIRSASAFGAGTIVIPERRTVGVTATAWKTSAGAAARVPVARATNLTQVLRQAKQNGFYVLGLDGGGDVSLPELELADEPLIVVVGNEGKGLSRLVSETCDQIVSIPINAAMESLNASMAAGITLYEIANKRRASQN
ncbi:23S rRNA (guanosine(2251)-2'-O)-methyltransferase RlmB [Pseudoglutamicibacter albus]|uniref:23S rRNA (Guanosine2251-2'-O)-methyltransferase n=1 Tax=Pseudoglutamicibacter albus TaxID=98671 RepID=A0ABU1YX69_9MICC|nr:23S rRNA (guanosine(2251)-2'-O)-methyltransferase RlmB [Pseudoglutamicibacter albus]MDR7292970.1 23S rRNA (guanosine2251-2'-O)-methyltransferase [Pseudoglutamicibacter albus]